MYQVIGKIVYNKNIAGLMVYDYDRKSVFRATLKDCVAEVKNGNMSNLAIVGNKLDVTDGSISKLPIYDVNGKSVGENLPVILERVTNNGSTVGYTLITKEGYKKCKTADLVKSYNEFYNAKVVTKDGTTFLSAKRGTFKELELNNIAKAKTSSVPEINDDNLYICRPEDYEISVNEDGEKVLVRYVGKDKKIRIPRGIDIVGNWEAIIPEDSVVESIIIPEGVTYIGDGAFAYCTSIKSVTIPDSVTEIGYEAFSNCGLTDIVIPDSVTFIGESAFENCESLKRVTISNNVKAIYNGAFSGCTELESIIIPNSVTEIGWFAFSGCEGLTRVTIPDSVTSIGEGAFDGTEWYNSQPDGVIYTGRVAYGFKGEMPENTSIVLKDDTKSISIRAFEDCTGLTSVTIPDSVTEIGMGAFESCVGLKSVTIGNGVQRIDAYAFRCCTSLTNIKIGNSVTYIGESAFKYCTSLTSIEIPNSVKSLDGRIGEGVFEKCTGLKSVTIGNGVTEMGSYAFHGCTGLTSLKIGNNITNTGTYTFYGCRGLKSVIIPEGVTDINAFSFTDCTGLTSIIIPDSVEWISDGAFAGCTGLTSVTIPANVTHIDYKAFNNCPNLIVKCPKGSYAEQHCKDNNIRYKIV